jgi:hypothetical protein
MEIKTPSGYIVTLKEEKDLTFRDKREIQKAMMTGMSLDTKNGKPVTTMNGSAILDAQDQILRSTLISITFPDGTQHNENMFDTIMGWKEKDGEAVYKIISEMLNNQGKIKN